MPKTQTENRVGATSTRAFDCKCEVHQEKPRRLVLRQDLAGTVDGHAKIALCVMVNPPTVHVWTDGEYQVSTDLELRDNRIVSTESGEIVAEPAPPSLAEMDTDDEPPAERPSESTRRRQGDSEPASRQHVNLDGDGYY